MADEIRATPRSPLFGLFSDIVNVPLDYMSSPERSQQMQGLAAMLRGTGVPSTLQNLSYDPSGRGLFTGAGGLGGTSRMRPEAIEALMTVAPMVGPTARVASRGAMAAGRAGEQLAERAVPQIMERGGLPAEMLQDLAQGSRSQALPTQGRSGFGLFDPRYDPRVNEQARMQAMTRDIQLDPNVQNAPTVSLADFEGRPFITSMADRTAAGGQLMGINDVAFNRPVGLLGGQDYMFRNPGMVWSSGNTPAKALMKYADEVKSATGQNPLYLPYRMAPTGGDFAQMTGETMLNYADAAMGKGQKKALDKQIKKFIPDWLGVSDPDSIAQFRLTPDKQRKAIKAMMDKQFRDEGGLNIGSARLAVSDPAQLAAQEGGVMNVGEIFAGSPILKSTHPAYPGGVPGKGIGTLAEDLNIFELLPQVVQGRGIPDPRNPRASDLRAMQMKPYAGVINSELLKSLGY